MCEATGVAEDTPEERSKSHERRAGWGMEAGQHGAGCPGSVVTGLWLLAPMLCQGPGASVSHRGPQAGLGCFPLTPGSVNDFSPRRWTCGTSHHLWHHVTGEG